VHPYRLAVFGVAALAPLRALYALLFPYHRPAIPTSLGRQRTHEPMTGEAVDAIYRADRWPSMRTFADSGRYGEIVEWIRRLAPEGPVLDVGAGDGLLWEAMTGLHAEYLGVDIAAETMARMQAKYGGPRCRFVTGDATTYVPERAYQIIVLNDMLYFLDEPVRHARRLAGYLAAGGTLIVAMNLGRHNLKILHGLHRAFEIVEESYVMSARGRSFVQLALRPPQDGAWRDSGPAGSPRA
jgi:2-polyprenyl-3-methyl-5-hydroxy-6-metoxy-1,4-benzoquinol methylase